MNHLCTNFPVWIEKSHYHNLINPLGSMDQWLEIEMGPFCTANPSKVNGGEWYYLEKDEIAHGKDHDVIIKFKGKNLHYDSAYDTRGPITKNTLKALASKITYVETISSNPWESPTKFVFGGYAYQCVVTHAFDHAGGLKNDSSTCDAHGYKEQGTIVLIGSNAAGIDCLKSCWREYNVLYCLEKKVSTFTKKQTVDWLKAGYRQTALGDYLSPETLKLVSSIVSPINGPGQAATKIGRPGQRRPAIQRRPRPY